MSDKLKDHIAWLRNTRNAVSDAIDDHNYQNRTQNLVYLAFDPSILFAPLSLRHKPPQIENPEDWLDIAADIIFWSLEDLNIDEFGYQLVMPYATYLTVLYNYRIDLEFIESIENSKDIDDIFYRINSRMSGNSNDYSRDASATLEDFLRRSEVKHNRLERLLNYIKSKKIVLESVIFDAGGMKRTRVTKEEFDQLYKQINTFRSEPNAGSSREMFTKAIEVIGLLDSKKKTQEFHAGRYLFLAWPKARSYYKSPDRYHRVITTLLLKVMAIQSDADVFLVDLRDNLSYLTRKVRETIECNRSLSDWNYQNILTIYESIIGFMDSEMKRIFQAESAPQPRSSDLGRLSTRDILSATRVARSRTRKTLDELGEEFKVFESVAGWDDLPDDHPIKILIENAKPQP